MWHSYKPFTDRLTEVVVSLGFNSKKNTTVSYFVCPQNLPTGVSVFWSFSPLNFVRDREGSLTAGARAIEYGDLRNYYQTFRMLR